MDGHEPHSTAAAGRPNQNSGGWKYEIFKEWEMFQFEILVFKWGWFWFDFYVGGSVHQQVGGAFRTWQFGGNGILNCASTNIIIKIIDYKDGWKQTLII